MVKIYTKRMVRTPFIIRKSPFSGEWQIGQLVYHFGDDRSYDNYYVLKETRTTFEECRSLIAGEGKYMPSFALMHGWEQGTVRDGQTE